ncbi:MAG: hypothetical protein R2991_09725 [Thermoanaerobaculia bacterium]
MPEGVIAGGWSYVIAAYGITTTVLVLYVVSLFKRSSAAREVSDGR